MTDLPPRIELLPLKAALPMGLDGETTVLVRIRPLDLPPQDGPRPPLNLALVIDRSGSMSGHPLAMARKATQVGLRKLEAQDRVSVVIFDDEVELLVPSQPAENIEHLCRVVEGITDGGSTALHAGWLDGAMQVAGHLNPQALNRVLLLSDGHANVGKRRVQEIVPDVAGLTKRGVSTSTIGLGTGYDEDLLRGMAVAGDGNFEHIEDPEQLPRYFDAEFSALSRTTGHTVSLGIEPNPALGSLRQEVLNDLARNDLGRYQLPNLMAGQPIEIVLTLHVPAQPQGVDLGITRVRLAWTGRDGVRRKMRAQLNLPVVSGEAYDLLPENEEVRLALELQRNARAKRDAVDRLDAGDVLGAQRVLRSRREVFGLVAPAPAFLRSQELDELADLERNVAGDANVARKRAASQSFDRSRSKR
ncbi:vWA domain-containing protein [Deinococcus hopiensis]|uniref:Ca-activated chloride channel family protein n=1 Tax=Deinococcus hopiensis KR-140 TaxID=695939 RepID=A0A1W1UMX8_9DEIO|nr:VWA domain-containing protein [Deinococcus hopiensis]SMB82064.1 Ca-activated chloride channel family protein [Deinococcus hopiensis KR-140]